jgi:hypothetical protein
MKKKTRDLKKYYRGLEAELADFDIDMSDESWYNMWHTHLDWTGMTTFSNNHRVRHIQYYVMMINKIEQLTKNSITEFQAWIYIDNNDGGMDAIYFHTNNPHSKFPFRLEGIELNFKIPHYITSSIDLKKFNIGRYRIENGYSYFIEKKELGVSVIHEQI